MSKGRGKQWQPTPKNFSSTQCTRAIPVALTGLWFLPKPAQRLNTNEWIYIYIHKTTYIRCGNKNNCVQTFTSMLYYIGYTICLLHVSVTHVAILRKVSCRGCIKQLLNLCTNTGLLLLFICLSGSAAQSELWPPRHTRFLDHTQRRAAVGRTALDEWSARRRDLYLTTQNKHIKHPCNGGIRTHESSKRTTVDLRLRPRGHWDRHKYGIIS
jgi:hypothetical protein